MHNLVHYTDYVVDFEYNWGYQKKITHDITTFMRRLPCLLGEEDIKVQTNELKVDEEGIAHLGEWVQSIDNFGTWLHGVLGLLRYFHELHESHQLICEVARLSDDLYCEVDNVVLAANQMADNASYPQPVALHEFRNSLVTVGQSIINQTNCTSDYDFDDLPES